MRTKSSFSSSNTEAKVLEERRGRDDVVAETAGLARVAKGDTHLIQGGACGYYPDPRWRWLLR